METKEYKLNEDINTFFMQAESIPQDIPNIFVKLEKMIGSFNDRQVYGVAGRINGGVVYMACVKEKFEGEAKQYGLQSYTIPKGDYLYVTLNNWRDNLQQIPKLFCDLMNLPEVKKNTICLEDYTSPHNMLAMVQRA